jgi:hypothetical protein
LIREALAATNSMEATSGLVLHAPAHQLSPGLCQGHTKTQEYALTKEGSTREIPVKGKLVHERGAGSRDLESGERGFLILIFLISYYCSQGDLLPWVIKLWTYKIVGRNIYYRSRINEYVSMVVGERIFYHG